MTRRHGPSNETPCHVLPSPSPEKPARGTQRVETGRGDGREFPKMLDGEGQSLRAVLRGNRWRRSSLTPDILFGKTLAVWLFATSNMQLTDAIAITIQIGLEG